MKRTSMKRKSMEMTPMKRKSMERTPMKIGSTPIQFTSWIQLPKGKRVEGELCLLEVPEVIRCMLFCILEAVEVCWRCWRRCAVCYSVC